MNIVINGYADIESYPQPDKAHPADSRNQLTIGDLHGNALKLMYFLIRQNVIELDAKLYPELVRIYRKPAHTLEKEDIDAFDKIITSIKAFPVGTVRLIGDELCDRGSNDYFTLKILERLGELKVPVEILISNHSIDFMDQYETQDDFIPARLTQDHSRSMTNLQELITQGLVLDSTIENIIHKTVKPTLKALSYTLDKENNKITVYSHAGIDLAVIASLAKKLSVDYCHDTVEHLAQTIDLINAKIATHLSNNTLHTLYEHEFVMDGYESHSIDSGTAPLEFIMWNRNYSELKRPAKHERGYGLDFIHGHDLHEHSHNNIFNLDNVLGKDYYHQQGDYNILYSQELPSYQSDILTRKLAKPIVEEEKKAEKPIDIVPPKIVEMEYTQQRQMSQAEKLAFDNKAKKLFAEVKKAGLLSKENRELIYLKVLDFMIDNVADCLNTLKKAKILTQDNFIKLLDRYCLPNTLKNLFELKLLTHEAFDTITLWDLHTPHRFNNALEKLKKIENLYTKENALLLMNCAENAGSIMSIISLNNEFNTQAILNSLVKRTKYAHAIYSFLANLPMEEQASYFNIALELEEYNYRFTTSIDKLRRNKLAIQDNLEIIIKFKKSYEIADFLIALDGAKLLTPEYRTALINLPQLSDASMRSIADFISKNIVTQDNLACLLKAGDHFDSVATALEKLEKAQQCTPLARTLIEKYPQFAVDISLTLLTLNEGKLLTPENIAILDKSLQSSAIQNVRSRALQWARILCQLNSLAMLTAQTRELAYKSAADEESINDSLKRLSNDKLLTPDLCVTLLEQGRAARSLTSLYIELNKIKMLTPEMQNALLTDLEHASELYSALWKLLDDKLLNPTTWKLMLDNSKHASHLALAYTELSKNNLLEHLPTLIKYAEHSWTLAYAMIELNKNDLFDKTNYDIMLANPKASSGLAQGLISLSHNNIYTPELRDFLVYFAQQPEASRSLSSSTLPLVLAHLNEAKILNETCLTHIKRLNAKEADDLLKFTCLAKKYRILTQENFIAMTTALKQKYFVSNDFYKLLDRLEKAGLVSPAKLKRSQTTFDKLIACRQFIKELECAVKTVVPLSMERFDKIIAQQRDIAIAKVALAGPKVRFFSAIDSSAREVVAVRPVLFHKARY